MRPWPRFLRRLVAPANDAEVSRVVVGSTGSGKSQGELVELVRLAESGGCAIVLLDGHGPLASSAAGYWAHRGHASRLVYEPLNATDRVLCWNMLPRSGAADPSRRILEDAEATEDISQCFLAQRSLLSVSDKPYTKEWLDAAIALCLAQPQSEPLTSLPHAFRVDSPDYERLLRECRQQDIVAKFRELERLRRKNAVQYEVMTGAARRLLELTCGSEAVRLRARPGRFIWLDAIRERKLIAFDGGGLRSRELKRTLFLLVSLQVIQAVRRHFGETQRPLPVVLVLEEAGALGLVTPFVLGALQELRKAGLSLHILTQSCLDFGDRSLFELVLANAPWQCWYQVLSPADQELGAKALTNAAFDARAVQFTRVRTVREGDALTAPWRARVREVIDPYYKSPSLQEQEFRTRLATLRVGERLVRVRRRVRRERVRMIRPPSVPGGFEAFTRDAIARVRQQPIYLPAVSPDATPEAEPLPDAAARLRAQRGE
jgi:hypothetical protein